MVCSRCPVTFCLLFNNVLGSKFSSTTRNKLYLYAIHFLSRYFSVIADVIMIWSWFHGKRFLMFSKNFPTDNQCIFASAIKRWFCFFFSFFINASYLCKAVMCFQSFISFDWPTRNFYNFILYHFPLTLVLYLLFW